MSDNIQRNHNFWVCGKRRLSLKKPLVMGILNVTPDSFYDGGHYLDSQAAVDRARLLVRQGADIIDVGGESTRPGSTEVEPQEELERVCPVITRLSAELDVAISIDTRHLSVAQAALNAGADIINNVMSLDAIKDLARIAAGSGAGLVVMHMRGTPQTMASLTAYDDVLAEVQARLRAAVDLALENGVAVNQIVVDPGIGFAKETRHNLELLARLQEIRELAPVLVGGSRKRFIGDICNEPVPQKRIGGSLAVVVMSVLNGASIVRVHDVKESCQALSIVAAIQKLENRTDNYANQF